MQSVVAVTLAVIDLNPTPLISTSSTHINAIITHILELRKLIATTTLQHEPEVGN